MSNCTRSGRVPILCWGWVSHEGAEMLHHIDGHLDDLHYKYILQNVMMFSVLMLYPNDLIHFQQGHSSIYGSRLVHEWLKLQAEVELIDRPSQAPDMNHIEITWSKLKRTMQETWPVLPSRNIDDLLTFVSDA